MFQGFFLLHFAYRKIQQKLSASFRGFPLLHFAYRKIQQKLSASFRGFPLLHFLLGRKFSKNCQPLSEASPRGEALPRSGGDEGRFHSKNKNKFTHGLNHAGANQLRAQAQNNYARRRKKTQIFPASAASKTRSASTDDGNLQTVNDQGGTERDKVLRR